MTFPIVRGSVGFVNAFERTQTKPFRMLRIELSSDIVLAHRTGFRFSRANGRTFA
jgi:hypothetical protein